MELKNKIKKLENKNLNWFEIAELLDVSYEEVRYISEEEYEKNKEDNKDFNPYSAENLNEDVQYLSENTIYKDAAREIILNLLTKGHNMSKHQWKEFQKEIML